MEQIMSETKDTAEQKTREQTTWLELNIDGQKVNLNPRGLTEKNSTRFISQGDKPYAVYVGGERSDMGLYVLEKNGETTERKHVANLFVREGSKDGKDYFFLSGKDVTVNLHGPRELVAELKDQFRKMEADVKAAIEAHKAKSNDSEPSRPRPR